MVDGGYVKAYVNEQRIGQLNGLTIARPNKIELDIPSADQNGTLITDIRIAAGGRKLWDALSTSGRAVTHGILFATGSAQLRPQSTPTLKEIGDLLTQHPDLRLTIEGHTDAVGDAAANQTLSEQRAASVKAFLVSTYGVSADRLQTKGFGATKPVAPNTTPEGRQQNRRVELVKQ
jgi:outer membrane protein OmpA-like peptidoglycan-associated protein